MLDMTYITNGFFTTFIPETAKGEDAWRVMANSEGGENGRILTILRDRVIGQMRRAGLSVGKAKKSAINVDEILAELGV